MLKDSFLEAISANINFELLFKLNIQRAFDVITANLVLGEYSTITNQVEENMCVLNLSIFIRLIFFY